MLQNSYVFLMAEYNQWMNLKLYDACSQLSSEQLNEDRRAFFGSIIGTLNHLAVADTIWLKRMSTDLSHHRGQISTLLSQAGVDVGVTDLLAIIPSE